MVQIVQDSLFSPEKELVKQSLFGDIGAAEANSSR
jgi:hypothetical protein